MSRAFMMGELMGGSGGMECESSKDCKNRSWTVILTDAENESLPEFDPDKSLHAQSYFIFDHLLGVVTCEECLLRINKRGAE